MIGGVRADEEGEIEVREGGVGRGSDERSRSADWEGPGGRGPLPGGHGGGQRRFCGLMVIWRAAGSR